MLRVERQSKTAHYDTSLWWIVEPWPRMLLCALIVSGTIPICMNARVGQLVIAARFVDELTGAKSMKYYANGAYPVWNSGVRWGGAIDQPYQP